MATVATQPERLHIVSAPGVCGGKPCVAGTRIRVLDIYVLHELEGKTPDEIVQDFPQLTMSDVFAALAYLWDHRQEILDSFQDARAAADKLAPLFPSALQAKLRDKSAAPLPPR